VPFPFLARKAVGMPAKGDSTSKPAPFKSSTCCLLESDSLPPVSRKTEPLADYWKHILDFRMFSDRYLYLSADNNPNLDVFICRFRVLLILSHSP
jgi:hypothetical protein